MQEIRTVNCSVKRKISLYCVTFEFWPKISWNALRVHLQSFSMIVIELKWSLQRNEKIKATFIKIYLMGMLQMWKFSWLAKRLSFMTTEIYSLIIIVFTVKFFNFRIQNKTRRHKHCHLQSLLARSIMYLLKVLYLLFHFYSCRTYLIPFCIKFKTTWLFWSVSKAEQKVLFLLSYPW